MNSEFWKDIWTYSSALFQAVIAVGFVFVVGALVLYAVLFTFKVDVEWYPAKYAPSFRDQPSDFVR